MSTLGARPRAFGGIILLLLLLSPLTMAQHIRGAVEGSVTDPSGLVISGVKVTLQNPATGAEIASGTSVRGSFRFQNLEAGIYNLTFEQSGCRKHITKDVNVKVGSVTPVNVTLEVGTTEQVV